ncbi:hypothetical protein vBSenI1_107 [Salmonella phage vB_Sen_I1]|uniref:Uncharacterized protein n=1 Tax=Salmonella phage vB_Sen_I1 TaxID=2723910 RepID=A0A7L5CE90_9CAUD|nr:hypothetical protein vBSenI1_107 [Salmonella phage vB_Sen_I1]
MLHFANKILLFLPLSQIFPNYLNSSPKSPQIRCSAPILRPHPSSLPNFSRSLPFPSNLYNHTPSHRSHKNFIGLAHLNPRKPVSDLHISHRIRTGRL